MKHPPLPPKQCCFTEKYLCGLKTTLIGGEEEAEEGGKDDFQKNQSIKPYKGESVPTLLSEIVALCRKLTRGPLMMMVMMRNFKMISVTQVYRPSSLLMHPENHYQAEIVLTVNFTAVYKSIQDSDMTSLSKERVNLKPGSHMLLTYTCICHIATGIAWNTVPTYERKHTPPPTNTITGLYWQHACKVDLSSTSQVRQQFFWSTRVKIFYENVLGILL